MDSYGKYFAREKLEEKLKAQFDKLRLKELQAGDQFRDVKAASRSHYRRLNDYAKEILSGVWNLDDYDTAEQGAAWMLAWVLQNLLKDGIWCLTLEPKSVTISPFDECEIFIKKDLEELVVDMLRMYEPGSIDLLRNTIDRAEQRWKKEEEEEKLNHYVPDVPNDVAPGHSDVVVKLETERKP